MSIRLNVVLSQAAQGPPQRGDLESELAARLMGTAGLDLSLIGALDSLTESSTDRLMLERLSGDLALLSWADPATAAAQLAAANVQGHRARHSLDLEAPEQRPTNGSPAAGEAPLNGRRIYFFQLSDHSAAGLHAALQKLLQERRVVTFQLGSPRPAAAPAGPRQPSPSAPAAAPNGNEAPPAASTGQKPLPPRRPAPADSPVARDPWDALVDELNDSNI